MIKTEFLNNGALIRHYSDKGYFLLQVETGIKYSEAVDICPCPFTYIETDEPQEEDENILNGENDYGI
jgi:hypothetical protein